MTRFNISTSKVNKIKVADDINLYFFNSLFIASVGEAFPPGAEDNDVNTGIKTWAKVIKPSTTCTPTLKPFKKL